MIRGNLWRGTQREFHWKLHVKREYQRRGIRARHEVQMARWKAEEWQWRQWWVHCHAVCEYCEWPSCRCNRKPPDSYLTHLLRRLAGINPHHNIAQAQLDEFSSAGKDGPRCCLPNSWDNVVRYAEDL